MHDGPGIRTTVFLKGCPLRCAWCCNPESQGFLPDVWHDPRLCRKCLRCVKACPYGAIAPSADDEPFKIDRTHCGVCSAPCVQVCPAGAMKQVGETLSSMDVVRIVERDISFYFPDGGVTLSGGEPLCQPEFAAEVLSVLHDHGIATAVETSGCVSWDAVAAVAQWVDLFLFDLKHLDPEVHRKYTGSDNKLIIENLRRLANSGARIILRVPLVPGVNSDEVHMRHLAKFALSLGIDEVDVLPLHKLAGHKYRRLGRALPVFEVPSQSEVEAAKKTLEEQELRVVVGG